MLKSTDSAAAIGLPISRPTAPKVGHVNRRAIMAGRPPDAPRAGDELGDALRQAWAAFRKAQMCHWPLDRLVMPHEQRRRRPVRHLLAGRAVVNHSGLTAIRHLKRKVTMIDSTMKLPTTGSPPPVMVLVGADKGGVGKTTVVADYVRVLKPRLVDTQVPNGDLRGFYPDAEILDLAATSAQMKIFDSRCH
jgi:hypothetical protein